MQEVYFDEKEYLRTFSHPYRILLMPKAKLETIRDSEGKKYTMSAHTIASLLRASDTSLLPWI